MKVPETKVVKIAKALLKAINLVEAAGSFDMSGSFSCRGIIEEFVRLASSKGEAYLDSRARVLISLGSDGRICEVLRDSEEREGRKRIEFERFKAREDAEEASYYKRPLPF